MKLYIVRHGETYHNKKRITQGQFDSKLTKEGLDQVKKLAKRLSNVKFDFVYSSDLSRASDTTKEIMKFQKCKVKYVEALRERNLGKFENLPSKNIFKYFEKNDRNKALPGGGESLREASGRVVRYIEKLKKRHKKDTILVSAHGGVKNYIIQHYFKKYLNQDNASVTIVKFYDNNECKIELENCTEHLK